MKKYLFCLLALLSVSAYAQKAPQDARVFRPGAVGQKVTTLADGSVGRTYDAIQDFVVSRNEAYQIGDLVRYNGDIYEALLQGTTAPDAVFATPPGRSWVKRFEYGVEKYVEDITYPIDALVSKDGVVYRALTANASNPVAGSDWIVVSGIIQESGATNAKLPSGWFGIGKDPLYALDVNSSQVISSRFSTNSPIGGNRTTWQNFKGDAFSLGMNSTSNDDVSLSAFLKQKINLITNGQIMWSIDSSGVVQSNKYGTGFFSAAELGLTPSLYLPALTTNGTYYELDYQTLRPSIVGTPSFSTGYVGRVENFNFRGEQDHGVTGDDPRDVPYSLTVGTSGVTEKIFAKVSNSGEDATITIQREESHSKTYVDAKYGSDANLSGMENRGMQNRSDRPFSTIQTAITLSREASLLNSNHTIHVRPGSYAIGTITLLDLDTVRLVCDPGVTITGTFVSGTTRNIHLSITGKPTLVAGNSSSGFVKVEGPTSYVYIDAHSIESDPASSSDNVLVCNEGELVVNTIKLIGRTSMGSSSSTLLTNGVCRINAKTCELRSGAFNFYVVGNALQPTPAKLYVNADYVENSAGYNAAINIGVNYVAYSFSEIYVNVIESFSEDAANVALVTGLSGIQNEGVPKLHLMSGRFVVGPNSDEGNVIFDLGQDTDIGELFLYSSSVLANFGTSAFADQNSGATAADQDIRVYGVVASTKAFNEPILAGAIDVNPLIK